MFKLARPPVVIIRNFFKFFLPAAVVLIILASYMFEPRLEYDFILYNRKWVNKEIETVAPVSECFNPDKVSAKYNLTDALYGPRHNEIQAGIDMRIGMDCYAFAGTIPKPQRKSAPAKFIPPEQRTQYHTYWRVDLAPFGVRQEWMLKAFFATQDLATSRLILWSNGDFGHNDILTTYLSRYPDSFTTKIADTRVLAKGTRMEDSPLLDSKDSKAWLDSDFIRLLVLWNYGGVWIDMDMLLTRDLAPLLEHEYVTQWDCYSQKYRPFNGAHLRFHQHSPYLCEAFDIMAQSDPPHSSSTDWGSLLYLKLWRRLVEGSIPPFKVLPWCFTDARLCRMDNRLPDPLVPDGDDKNWKYGLEEGGRLDRILSQIFAVHLHNRWDKDFPEESWIRRLLLDRMIEG